MYSTELCIVVILSHALPDIAGSALYIVSVPDGAIWMQ